MTYTGLQRRLGDWTGVSVGHEGFLHCERTTFIGEGQFGRFADAMLDIIRPERVPLAAFCGRFDALFVEVAEFEQRIDEPGHDDELVADYLRLHREMQPYSYVFGYGEDAIVAQIVRERLDAAGVRSPEAMRAAFALPGDLAAAHLLRGLGLDAADAQLLHLTRRQARVRTQRRELWNRIEAAIAPRLTRRAVSLGAPATLAFELTPDELLGLDALPDRAALQARIGSTFLAWRGDVHLFTGAPHARIGASLAREDAPLDDELRGATGHPGHVQGLVRIVRSEADQDAMRQGEILVSDMTSPELMTACSRAAAIVTDRGGLLCHAAIVAREHGVPCVLATERATRVLRDGDLVEVDATNGLVRVLRRAV